MEAMRDEPERRSKVANVVDEHEHAVAEVNDVEVGRSTPNNLERS